LKIKSPTAKTPSTDTTHAIPNEAIEALARCLLPAIRSYFESDKGWHEFAEWQLCKDIEKLYGRRLPDIITSLVA
jgi:hypothetical protein